MNAGRSPRLMSSRCWHVLAVTAPPVSQDSTAAGIVAAWPAALQSSKGASRDGGPSSQVGRQLGPIRLDIAGLEGRRPRVDPVSRRAPGYGAPLGAH